MPVKFSTYGGLSLDTPEELAQSQGVRRLKQGADDYRSRILAEIAIKGIKNLDDDKLSERASQAALRMLGEYADPKELEEHAYGFYIELKNKQAKIKAKADEAGEILKTIPKTLRLKETPGKSFVATPAEDLKAGHYGAAAGKFALDVISTPGRVAEGIKAGSIEGYFEQAKDIPDEEIDAAVARHQKNKAAVAKEKSWIDKFAVSGGDPRGAIFSGPIPPRGETVSVPDLRAFGAPQDKSGAFSEVAKDFAVGRGAESVFSSTFNSDTPTISKETAKVRDFYLAQASRYALNKLGQNADPEQLEILAQETYDALIEEDKGTEILKHPVLASLAYGSLGDLVGGAVTKPIAWAAKGAAKGTKAGLKLATGGVVDIDKAMYNMRAFGQSSGLGLFRNPAAEAAAYNKHPDLEELLRYAQDQGEIVTEARRAQIDEIISIYKKAPKDKRDLLYRATNEALKGHDEALAAVKADPELAPLYDEYTTKTGAMYVQKTALGQMMREGKEGVAELAGQVQDYVPLRRFSDTHATKVTEAVKTAGFRNVDEAVAAIKDPQHIRAPALDSLPDDVRQSLDEIAMEAQDEGRLVRQKAATGAEQERTEAIKRWETDATVQWNAAREAEAQGAGRSKAIKTLHQSGLAVMVDPTDVPAAEREVRRARKSLQKRSAETSQYTREEYDQLNPPAVTKYKNGKPIKSAQNREARRAEERVFAPYDDAEVDAMARRTAAQQRVAKAEAKLAADRAAAEEGQRILKEIQEKTGFRYRELTGQVAREYERVTSSVGQKLGKRVFVPEEMAEMLESMMKVVAVSPTPERDAVKLVKSIWGNLYEAPMAMFRRTRTLLNGNPVMNTYLVNNMTSAVELGPLSAGFKALNPELQGASLRAALVAAGLGDDKALKTVVKELSDGTKLTIEDFIRMAEEDGIVGQAFIKFEKDIRADERVMHKLFVKPLDKLAKVTGAEKINDVIENYQHLLPYMDVLDGTDVWSRARAVRLVQERAGIFRRMSPFEKKIMRNIIPIGYTWKRTMYPILMKQLANNPQRLQVFERLVNAGNQALADNYQYGHEATPMQQELPPQAIAPDYWQPDDYADFRIKGDLTFPDKAKTFVRIERPLNMLADLNPDEWGNQVNPVLYAIASVSLGADFSSVIKNGLKRATPLPEFFPDLEAITEAESPTLATLDAMDNTGLGAVLKTPAGGVYDNIEALIRSLWFSGQKGQAMTLAAWFGLHRRIGMPVSRTVVDPEREFQNYRAERLEEVNNILR